jgi:hypothetical protein
MPKPLGAKRALGGVLVAAALRLGFPLMLHGGSPENTGQPARQHADFAHHVFGHKAFAGAHVPHAIATRVAATSKPQAQDETDAVLMAEQHFEADSFRRFPALKTLADAEPEIWRETRGDITEALDIHRDGDPMRDEALQSVLERLMAKLRLGASNGSDATVLGFLSTEISLDRALRSNPLQCYQEALGQPLDFPALSQDAMDHYNAMQAALVAAYLDAGRSPVPVPTSDAADALMGRAIMSGPDAFTSGELTEMNNARQQPPDVLCALTIKLLSRIRAMPPNQAAALIRSVLHAH